MTECKHEHGDRVGPLGWVCGQCYEILHERPKRYSMVPCTFTFADAAGERGARMYRRQEVVWQSEIKKSNEGTTLSVFIAAVARRFQIKGLLDMADAYQQALSSMKELEAQFGASDYDWSLDSAIDIADEEMSCWDEAMDEGN